MADAGMDRLQDVQTADTFLNSDLLAHVLGSDALQILRCDICMDFFDTPIVLPCGHTFCLHCLTEMCKHAHAKGSVNMSVNNSGPPPTKDLRIGCPNCRVLIYASPILERNVTCNFIIQSLLESLRHKTRGKLASKGVNTEEVRLRDGKSQSLSDLELSHMTVEVNRLLAALNHRSLLDMACLEVDEIRRQHCQSLPGGQLEKLKTAITDKDAVNYFDKNASIKTKSNPSLHKQQLPRVVFHPPKSQAPNRMSSETRSSQDSKAGSTNPTLRANVVKPPPGFTKPPPVIPQQFLVNPQMSREVVQNQQVYQYHHQLQKHQQQQPKLATLHSITSRYNQNRDQNKNHQYQSNASTKLQTQKLQDHLQGKHGSTPNSLTSPEAITGNTKLLNHGIVRAPGNPIDNTHISNKDPATLSNNFLQTFGNHFNITGNNIQMHVNRVISRPDNYDNGWNCQPHNDAKTSVNQSQKEENNAQLLGNSVGNNTLDNVWGTQYYSTFGQFPNYDCGTTSEKFCQPTCSQSSEDSPITTCNSWTVDNEVQYSIASSSHSSQGIIGQGSKLRNSTESLGDNLFGHLTHKHIDGYSLNEITQTQEPSADNNAQKRVDDRTSSGLAEKQVIGQIPDGAKHKHLDGQKPDTQTQTQVDRPGDPRTQNDVDGQIPCKPKHKNISGSVSDNSTQKHNGGQTSGHLVQKPAADKISGNVPRKHTAKQTPHKLNNDPAVMSYSVAVTSKAKNKKRR